MKQTLVSTCLLASLIIGCKKEVKDSTTHNQKAESPTRVLSPNFLKPGNWWVYESYNTDNKLSGGIFSSHTRDSVSVISYEDFQGNVTLEHLITNLQTGEITRALSSASITQEGRYLSYSNDNYSQDFNTNFNYMQDNIDTVQRGGCYCQGYNRVYDTINVTYFQYPNSNLACYKAMDVVGYNDCGCFCGDTMYKEEGAVFYFAKGVGLVYSKYKYCPSSQTSWGKRTLLKYYIQ